MKTLAIILSVFMLFSMSTAANALAEQKIPGPPLAQSLVREGTLAVNLANALKIGSPANEAEAESALTSAGIAPRNGWVGDYPVTPDVVIELRNTVGSAADSKGLSMSKEEALNVFDNVTKDYELPVQAVNAGPVVSPNTSPDPPDPTVMNNYYTQEGPPVVTYYAPPVDYSYLYNYVPYPFWWLNAWFPGYYMLADFILPLFGSGWWNHGYWGGYGYGYWGGYGRYGYWGGYGYNHWRGYDYGGHGGHGDGRYAVSNHYRHPDGGATHRIDPANRAQGGFSDGNRAGGQRWANPAAQRSAGAIYNRSSHVNTARDSVSMSQPVNNRTGSNRGSNLNSGRSFNAPSSSYSANRSFNQPAQRASYQTRQNTYSSGRMGYNGGSNRGSNLSSGRSFNAPSSSYSANRSFNQPAQRASYQTRQSMYSAGRGGGYNASSVANKGQFGGGGRSSSSGHGSSGGSSGGRASSGGSGHGQHGRS
ncbi:MAG TPA: hypothetical protein VLZ10_15060 [Thermodesulfobacteriota bacterium]|nr:hypothetical protein [Thermodesulfobacteriota bacterium]